MLIANPKLYSLIADSEGIKISQLERRMKVSNAAYANAIKRGTNVGQEMIDRLSIEFPHLDMPTLILQSWDGDADVKESTRKQVIALGKHVPSRLRPEEYADAFGDWPGLPIFNEPITASFVATYRDTTAHVPQYYLHDPRFRDCDFGAIVTGDSMHPEIRHGDIVACKLINDTTFIVFGDIYYIVASNGLETCKYVQRVKNVRDGAEKRGKGGSKARYDEADITYDDERVLLVPYNTAVDPSPILKTMIERMYKVRGIIRGY